MAWEQKQGYKIKLPHSWEIKESSQFPFFPSLFPKTCAEYTGYHQYTAKNCFHGPCMVHGSSWSHSFLNPDNSITEADRRRVCYLAGANAWRPTSAGFHWPWRKQRRSRKGGASEETRGIWQVNTEVEEIKHFLATLASTHTYAYLGTRQGAMP